VIVETDGRLEMRLQMFPGTGGYSRVSPYRLADERLLLRDADACYTIDLTTRTVAKDEARRQVGTFFGLLMSIIRSGGGSSQPANGRNCQRSSRAVHNAA
jgi:hypothetical protein